LLHDAAKVDPSVLYVFLGGPDSPSSDHDILSQIRDSASRTFNGAESSYKVLTRRYREAPDIIHPEPGVDAQAEIDAEIASGLYDITLFLFQDRLGTPHPDGYQSFTVKELEQAIRLRRASQDNPPRPHIVVYKAARSWKRTEDRELARLPKDVAAHIMDRDNQRQTEHVRLNGFLEELRARPDYGKIFTVVVDENSDENIIDGAIRIISNYAARCKRLKLTETSDTPQAIRRDVGWPYPGIRDFAVSDWNVFFGREEKIAEALAAVDSGKKIITLNGGSGSGKTSLLRAGILVAHVIDSQ
jgi:hypothetical protein